MGPYVSFLFHTSEPRAISSLCFGACATAAASIATAMGPGVQLLTEVACSRTRKEQRKKKKERIYPHSLFPQMTSLLNFYPEREFFLGAFCVHTVSEFRLP